MGYTAHVTAVLALLRSHRPGDQHKYLHSTHLNGLTALHIAACNNHCKVAALLLNAGVQVRREQLRMRV